MTPVRAAGGVICRQRGAELEVLVVHRPKYDDWSFPKGKASEAEPDDECALREVEEETGLRCELIAELGSTSYVDGRGRPKVVRYWAMRVVDGEFAPNEEVDEIRWLPLDQAAATLTWARDVPLLEALVERVA